jgi:hypothetical protein
MKVKGATWWPTAKTLPSHRGIQGRLPGTDIRDKLRRRLTSSVVRPNCRRTGGRGLGWLADLAPAWFGQVIADDGDCRCMLRRIVSAVPKEPA